MNRLFCGSEVRQCRLGIANDNDAETQCPYYVDSFQAHVCAHGPERKEPAADKKRTNPKQSWFDVVSTKVSLGHNYKVSIADHAEYGRCLHVVKKKLDGGYVGHWVLTKRDLELIDIIQEFLLQHGGEFDDE